MLAVDDLIRKVAEALGPELDQTVIVFTSDNGILYGEHRMGEKGVAYEEAIRVPLYITVPGLNEARQTNALVLNNDLAPTLAALGGASPQHVDGRSLVPILRGLDPSPWRKRFLVEHWEIELMEMDVPDYLAVRTGADDWDLPNRLFIRYAATPGSPLTLTEHYLLDSDPFQIESRHADPLLESERWSLDSSLTALSACGQPSRPTCQTLEQ
jgi:arylsulfatase A-like enzyme